MRPAGPGEVAISLTDKTIEAVLSGILRTEPEPARLSLPKFKTEFAANLVPVFEKLGMSLAFDKDRADFSGITQSTREEDRGHISQIQHKTFIDVNEDGTEAAAATAVEIAKRAAPPPSTSIEIDHPFLYLIADESTGVVLFMGRMSDPRI
jgi:serine protease inhibitor